MTAHPSGLRPVVVIAFVFTLLALLIGGALAYVNIQRQIASRESVLHSHEVIGALETLLSTLKDSETGQRGYLLTTELKYLEPFTAALERVQAQAATVGALMGDNAAQAARFAQLQPVIEAKLDELRRTVALARDNDVPAFMAVVRSDIGRVLMDEVRTRVAAMQVVEQQLLQQRLADVRVRTSIMVLSILLTVAVGFVSVTGVFVLVRRHMTERRRLEGELAQSAQELRAASDRKDEFLATLAHELRNPLAPIRTGLEVMRLSQGDHAINERARSMMERQVAHMVRMVDDLLDVSRISRGAIELRLERVDLATVLQHALETSRPLIEANGHELVTHMPAEPIIVMADPTRLGQVFANILNNAARYTERGGRIEVSAAREGATVAVRIRDNGEGIAAADLQKIFELFTQVGRSAARSHGGLGIGLSLSSRLARMHGGTIDVASEGHGHGSEFVVRLPADAPQA